MSNYNTVFVNGEPFNCSYSMSLQDLLLYLDFDITRIVVEYNQQIVTNYDFENITVLDQDKLEVITVVGGG